MEQKIYDPVLALVKTGETISNACIKAGLTRVYFYRNATEKQKREVHAESKAAQIKGRSNTNLPSYYD